MEVTSLGLAKRLIDAGYYIFPARLVRQADGKVDKPPQPGVMWSRASSRDPADIERWLSRWPDTCWGVDAGKSGVVFVDIDPIGIGTWPDESSGTYRTPRGGTHVPYAEPRDRTIGCDNAGKLGPGLDVKGAGGYVVAYGSLPDVSSLPAVPARVIDAMLPGGRTEIDTALAQHSHSTGTAADGGTDDGALPDGIETAGAGAVTRDEANSRAAAALQRLAAAGPGERNSTLNEVAMLCGHFVPEFWPAEKIVGQLYAVARSIGLDESEIGPTIKSGLKAGMADPYALWVDPESPTGAPASTLSAPQPSRVVDLGPYLDGTYRPPQPTLGAERDDTVRMLYPGRWHTVVGLTGCGKSWLAAHHAVEMIRNDNATIVYAHFEEWSPLGTITRLRALGLDDLSIAERFIWLDVERRWSPGELAALLRGLANPPSLVVLDGINAACGRHGWAVNDPESVTAYRDALVAPAVKLGAAVMSLGHPPKAKDRQGERHGFGSTAWLDEVDGVGFRLIANRHAIRRGNVGSSALHIVKDRAGEVERYGRPDEASEGWTYFGSLVVDDSPDRLGTVARISAPARDESTGQTMDQTAVLARLIEEHLIKHGGEFESQRRLKESMRAADLTFNDRDIGVAVERLTQMGTIEVLLGSRGARGGKITSSASAVMILDQDQLIEGRSAVR